MQLSELKTSIREIRKPIRVWMLTPAGPILLNIEKKALIEALDVLHDGRKRAQTGLYIRDDGHLMKTPDAPADPDLLPYWEKALNAAAEQERREAVAVTQVLDAAGEEASLEDLF